MRSHYLATACCLLAAGALQSAFAAEAPAPPGVKTYAQDLVEREIAKNPDLKVLAMHVTPPKTKDNIIIASNIGRIGKKADADDLKVLKSGKPLIQIVKGGTGCSVELPLLDANKRTVGVLGATFTYASGGSKDECLQKAEAVRDELSRRISHVANLVEPAQFDPKVPTNTWGQHLVDTALDANPEVVILALHATPPGSKDNEIVASNIGRIGKKADSDDMDVVNTGVPKLELNETKDRFEVEERLLDVSGNNLGAVGVVFPYRQGEDKEALHKKADSIVHGFLQRHISNAKNLVEPYPYDPHYSDNSFAQKLVDKTLDAHPDVLILMIHGIVPGGDGGNVVVGSNIGRIGKKGDEDDNAVTKTGKPLLEVDATGARFETQMQLHDSKGSVVGSAAVVLPYKAGDDKAALQAKSEAILGELEKQIPSLASLFAAS